MGDPKGFLKVKRHGTTYRPVHERVQDYREVMQSRPADQAREQASRCMDCGTPFCHSACPVGNLIPEWNDLLFTGKWEKAAQLLQSTNNLPEITGRLCPALCEYACVLGINDDPVTIRENELSIIEHAFESGYIQPQPPKTRTGKKVAVIGSGPAGLACADQLNKAGHSVVLFEKDDKIGGILRYGIPDFKLDKSVLDRRAALLAKEGIEFRTSVEAGSADFSTNRLLREFDAVCLTGGSRVPRDLPVEGRGLKGIHFAMEYLIQSNKRIAGESAKDYIDARGKAVVVIGGGDTGADCVGTAHRQGAKSVTQIELMPKPPTCRTAAFPWPKYPLLFKTSSSHEEGGERQWSILTKKFVGVQGTVAQMSCVQVDFPKDDRGCPQMNELPGTAFQIPADLVILAMGFVFPEKKGLIQELGVLLDERGNVNADASYATSVPKVFAAGDIRRGQSLIVWAIAEGRKAAWHIDTFLMGVSALPR